MNFVCCPCVCCERVAQVSTCITTIVHVAFNPAAASMNISSEITIRRGCVEMCHCRGTSIQLV